MELTKNRGMYAENIFTRSCDYYRHRGIAIVEKRMVPINILKRVNEQTIIGRLLAKSYVDYCGCYQGQHLEIEVKETNEKNLSLNIIKPHQLEYMALAINHKSKVFLLVYFSLYDKFYLINFLWIQTWLKLNKTKTIRYEEIVKNGNELPIIYPGIIDFLKFI